MEGVIKFIELYNIEIMLGMGITISLLALILLINIIRTNKKIKLYAEQVKETQSQEIVSKIKDINGEIDNINVLNEDILSKIEVIDRELSLSLNKVGFLRYNAFEDVGRELSYSIALMDRKNNGFVLTSIYGNGESVSYSKPLTNGKSEISLSEEEELAIKKAIGN